MFFMVVKVIDINSLYLKEPVKFCGVGVKNPKFTAFFQFFICNFLIVHFWKKAVVYKIEERNFSVNLNCQMSILTK